MTTTHWTELKTCEADGDVMSLSEFIDDCLSGISIIGDITINPDGSIQTWSQRYVFADGEEPSAESPAGNIDWTSFAARVEQAKANEKYNAMAMGAERDIWFQQTCDERTG